MQTGKKQKTSITADDIFKRKSVAKKSENTGDSQDQREDNNGQENDEDAPGGEGSQDDSEKLQLNKRKRTKKANDQLS